MCITFASVLSDDSYILFFQTTTIERLKPDSLYYFRIQARNAGGEGAWSDVMCQCTCAKGKIVTGSNRKRRSVVKSQDTSDNTLRRRAMEIGKGV